MTRAVVRAIRATVILAILTGLLYPLAMTGIGQVLFHNRVEGSLVTVDGTPVGSSLIGQKWDDPEWFYGRPSAIDYTAETSSGSNLGPLSQALADRIKETAAGIVKLEGPYIPGLTVARIPSILLLASASGLDPDITPEAARFQATRIAAVRNLRLAAVLDLIRKNTTRPPLDLYGKARVNVLKLNIALDRLAGGRS